MKRKRIKFSNNWNNKLYCNIFISIRKWDIDRGNYYLKNLLKIFDIELRGKIIGEVKLSNVDIEKRLVHIDYYTILLDTGIVDVLDQLDLFREFGINPEDRVIILTFKRIK